MGQGSGAGGEVIGHPRRWRIPVWWATLSRKINAATSGGRQRGKSAMNWGELLIGVALLAVAGFLAYLFRQQRHKLAVMRATPSF